MYSALDGLGGPCTYSTTADSEPAPTETKGLQFWLELCMPFKSDIILCHTQLPSYPGFSSPCPQWHLFEFTEFWAVEQVDIHCTCTDKASLSNQTMESGTALATLLLPQNCFCKYKSFFWTKESTTVQHANVPHRSVGACSKQFAVNYTL